MYLVYNIVTPQILHANFNMTFTSPPISTVHGTPRFTPLHSLAIRLLPSLGNSFFPPYFSGQEEEERKV